MIIGISMGLETCQILGQVSHNLLYWKKNLPTNTCGPAGDWRENSLHPGQIIYGQRSGSQWENTPSRRRSKNGPMKSSILRMHENCEGSISSTRRTWNSKKPSRTRVRSWKHQSLLLSMPCKIMKNNCGSGGSNKVKTKLAWRKRMNLRDCVWEIRYRIIMRTLLHEKGTIHCNITTWYTNLFLCLKLWKFLQQKQRWTRNGKKWRKFRRGTWRKSKVRNKWSMKQGRRALQFILHHYWTYVIWKMLNWRQNTKNTKVELYSVVILWKTLWVLRSIHWTRIFSISNDSRQDHGYHLQIARLRWTSSRRSINLYPSKNGRCSHYCKFQNRSVQTFGFVYHDTNGLNHGPAWKTQSFLLKGICMVILWQDCYAKSNLRNSYWNMAGRKFQIGNVSLYIVKKDYSYLCMWMT